MQCAAAVSFAALRGAYTICRLDPKLISQRSCGGQTVDVVDLRLAVQGAV